MPGWSEAQPPPMAAAVDGRAYAMRVGIPRKVVRQFNQAGLLFSSRQTGCASCLPLFCSYILNPLKRADSDFDEDMFPRSSCLLFIEHAPCALPDRGRNIYPTPL
jgi:hypothetical protein